MKKRLLRRRLLDYWLFGDLSVQEANDLLDLIDEIPSFSEEQAEMLLDVSPRLIAKYCRPGNIPWTALSVVARA